MKGKTFSYFNASRKVLIAVGLIFILSGLIVGGVTAQTQQAGAGYPATLPLGEA